MFHALSRRIFERGGADREADAISIYGLIEVASVLQLYADYGQLCVHLILSYIFILRLSLAGLGIAS